MVPPNSYPPLLTVSYIIYCRASTTTCRGAALLMVPLESTPRACSSKRAQCIASNLDYDGRMSNVLHCYLLELQMSEVCLSLSTHTGVVSASEQHASEVSWFSFCRLRCVDGPQKHRDCGRSGYHPADISSDSYCRRHGSHHSRDAEDQCIPGLGSQWAPLGRMLQSQQSVAYSSALGRGL